MNQAGKNCEMAIDFPCLGGIVTRRRFSRPRCMSSSFSLSSVRCFARRHCPAVAHSARLAGLSLAFAACFCSGVRRDDSSLQRLNRARIEAERAKIAFEGVQF